MKKLKFSIKELFCEKTEKQLIKFLIVAFSTAIIYLFLLVFLTESLEIHYLLSAIIAGTIEGTINFFLNKTLTFKEKAGKHFMEEYGSFFTIRAFTGSTSIILIFVLTEFLKLHYLISSVIVLGIMVNFDFLANKFLNFKK